MEIEVSMVRIDTTFTAEGDTVVVVTYEQKRRKMERATFWALIGAYVGVLMLTGIEITR